MSSDKWLHFDDLGQVIGNNNDGYNEYDYVVFDHNQVEAIKLIIQKMVNDSSQK